MTALIKQEKKELQKPENSALELSIIEQVVVQGDLSKLNPEQRVVYYKKVCESAGLNPFTRPFEYILLNGKLTLYAKKDCTEQLRKINGISIEGLDDKIIDDLYIVKARAKTKDGRTDESTGAVTIGNLRGDAKANAIMKAECVPLDYEILTKTGFKHILDLEENEIVASVDHNTYEIEWHPLIQKSIFQDQTVTEYGNTCISFEITDNHTWMTESNSGVKGLKSFDSINTGTYLVLSGKCNSKDSILSKNEAAVLGWIITDGTIKSYKDELYRASICQSKQENFEMIDSALSDMKFTKGVSDNRERGWMDQHWWYLSKESTQNLFDKCGFKSTEDLSRIVCQLGLEERIAMLEAMMAADGDKKGNFGKGDLNTVIAFQILCALTGSLTKQVRIRDFKNSTQPFYLTRIYSYNRVARQNLIEGEKRETTVWCPTTKHGTWICRTDKGQVFVTGNTKAKRRVTLSISGLGWVDESEIESIPSAEKVSINIETGEIKNEEPVKPLYITSSQAKELQALISECEPEKQSKIWAFMEKKCNGDLSKFPLECFENTKKIVLERRAEYMAKLNPAPTSMDELVEDEDGE